MLPLTLARYSLRAVGRKDQTGVADLRLFIRLQFTGGAWFGFRRRGSSGRQRHGLQDADAHGINQQHFARLAGNGEKFAVRAERQGLRAQARQIQLLTSRRGDLIDRSDRPRRAAAPDRLRGGRRGLSVLPPPPGRRTERAKTASVNFICINAMRRGSRILPGMHEVARVLAIL